MVDRPLRDLHHAAEQAAGLIALPALFPARQAGRTRRHGVTLGNPAANGYLRGNVNPSVRAMPARTAVMRMTPAAAERVRGILARADQPAAGLPIGVKKGGCAG